MVAVGKWSSILVVAPEISVPILDFKNLFLGNKLSVTIKVDDVFDTKKFIINTENVIPTFSKEGYTQLMYAERRRDNRHTTITLNYNFGKKQKKRWKEEILVGTKWWWGGMDMDY
ncbi:MAG: hypothetical protein Ct9H300mP9_4060 [Candidatus Neomarinimicrobiota bacterium]|nr:MAG: hypothetical protein Ct9H300mP9_4060 [Candidatus Neomarinimicrobiota bacterium]